MSSLRLPRRGALLLLLIVGLMLAALVALAVFAVSRLPLLQRSVTVGAPVRWTGLPAAVQVRPEWTSFTSTSQVNDLLLHDGLLWAATDGGLVVWQGATDPGTATAMKFTVEHGLAANRVTSLAAGPDGAIWAGTVDGLSRYDRRGWQTFREVDGLPSNEIRDLVLGRDGMLWVATPAGLASYNGRDWETVRQGDWLVGLPSDAITSLVVDAANRLWIGSDAGVSRYDGGWQHFSTADGLTENEVIGLAIPRSGELWALTRSGFNRYDGTGWEFVTAPIPADANSGGAAPSGVVALPDGATLLAYAGAEGGLWHWDPASDEVQPYELDWDGPRLSAVNSVLPGAQGDLWLATDQGVLHVTTDDTVSLPLPDELPSQEISDMLLTADGLWLSSDVGVAHYDGDWTSFSTVNGLPSAAVGALAAAPDGGVWAVSTDPLDGLARFEAGTARWQSLICPIDAPPSRNVAAMLSDGDGDLWLATDNGVSQYNGREWRQFTVRDGLPANEIRDLTLDASGVWAATGDGLARYDGVTWVIVDEQPVSLLATAPDGGLWAIHDGQLFRQGGTGLDPVTTLPETTAVRDIAVNADGVWLATDGGVTHLGGGEWTTFTAADGLASDNVTAVGIDASGQVWAATSGDEQQVDIVRFADGRWQAHPLRDVAAETLSSNIVRQVLLTPDGVVWLATTEGVNRFDAGQWTSFSAGTGLPGRDVRALAYAFDAVWAATEAGLARFDGTTWQVFGTASHNQPGIGVQALTASPSGRLWMALEPGWPDALRMFDGQSWRVVPTLSANTRVTQLAVVPSAGQGDPERLVALAEEGGADLIGVLTGETWSWQQVDQLPVRVERFAVAPDGRLWAAGDVTGSESNDSGAGFGVFALAEQGLGPLVATYQTGAAASGSGLEFMSAGGTSTFAFGPDGRVLVAGPGIVYAFDRGASGALEPLNTYELPLPFSRHTFAVAVAPDGAWWAGTERGAARSDDGGATWETFYAPPMAPAWWGSVSEMDFRPDGGILLGTTAGGIGIYTGRAFDGVLRPSQGPVEWAREFLPVTGVTLDAGETLWAATNGGGVTAFNGTVWRVFAPDPALTGLVRTMTVDGDMGWIGTAGGMVVVSGLSRDNCTIERIRSDSGILVSLRDQDGNVWLGTEAAGLRSVADGSGEEVTQWAGAPISLLAQAPNGDLWVLNERHGWLTWLRNGELSGDESRWRRLPLDLSLIAADEINALAVAPDLSVWLGTEKGALIYDGRNWQRLSTAEGLADNDVRHILVQNDGTVWLVTAGGLSRYQPRGGATP